MVRDLDSVDEPPAANKLPMVTNKSEKQSLNRKSLQLSVLQDAAELTMEARAAALAQIEASIAPLRQMHYQCMNWNMSAR
jgi:hypothetical protein